MTLTDLDLHRILRAYDALVATACDEPVDAPNATARLDAMNGGSVALDETFRKVWAEAARRGIDMSQYPDIGHLDSHGTFTAR